MEDGIDKTVSEHTDKNAPPKKKKRWWLRILLILMLLPLLLIVGLLAYTQTGHFRNVVRNIAVQQANNYLDASVELDKIEGNIFGKLALVGLSLKDTTNESIVEFERLELTYTLSELLSKKLHINHIILDRPNINLVATDGGLNILNILPPAAPPAEPTPVEPVKAPRSPLGLDIVIDHIGIKDGVFSFVKADQNGTVIVAALEKLNLAVSGQYRPEGDAPHCEVQVKQISLQPLTPKLPPVDLQAYAGYRKHNIELDMLYLQFGQDELYAFGELGSLDALKPNLTLAIPQLHTNQLASILPGTPFANPISLYLTTGGPLSDFNVSMELQTPAGDVFLAAWTNLEATDAPCYEVKAELSRLNVAPILQLVDKNAAVVTSDISGMLLASGGGTDPLSLNTDIVMNLKHSTIGKHPVDLELAVKMAEAQISRLDLNLSLSNSRFSLSGNSGIAGFLNKTKKANADFAFNIQDFNAAVLSPMVDLASFINAKGMLSLDKPADANLTASQAMVALKFEPSVVKPSNLKALVEIETLDLNASYRAGRFTLASLAFKGMGLALQGQGSGEIAGDVDLNMHLSVIDDSFLALAMPDQSLEGSIDTSLHLTGDMREPKLDLRLDAKTVKFQDLVLESLEIRLANAGIQLPAGGAAPDFNTLTANADLEVSKLAFGSFQLDSVALNADVADDRLKLVLDVVENQSREIGLSLNVTPLMGEPWALKMERLKATADGRTWANQGDIALEASKNGVSIERFVLTNGVQEISLQGKAQLEGDQNLSVIIKNIDIEQTLALAKAELPITGNVDFGVLLKGSPRAPSVTGNLRVSDLNYADLPQVDIQADWRYAAQNAALQMIVQSEGKELFVADFNAPLHLGYPLPEKIFLADVLQGRIKIERLDFATIKALLPDDYKDLSGSLALVFNLSGTFAAPELDGWLSVRDVEYQQLPQTNLETQLDYRDSRFRADVQLKNTQQELLTANVSVPIQVSVPLATDFKAPEQIDGQVNINDLNLGLFSFLLPKEIDDMGGILRLDADITGKLKNPKFNADIELSQGRARSEKIGFHYRDIHLSATTNPQKVVLQELVLTSYTERRFGLTKLFKSEPIEGKMKVTAEVTMADFKPDDIEAAVTFDKFAPVSSRDRFASVSGDIQAGGKLDRFSVTGDITVEEARITIPDFGGGEKQVADVTVIGEEQDEIVLTNRRTTSDPFQDNYSVDVAVHIPGQVWLANPQSNVELKGDVKATKDFGEPLVLGGSAGVKRGFVEFMGKEFTLSKGGVTFTGATPPDPMLNLRADYEIKDNNEKVVIYIKITGRVSNPEFELLSNPEMEDADRISYLLFGKPQDKLNEDESKSLEAQAMAVVGGQLATRLNKMLGKTLALDVLKIRSGEEGLESGSLTVGKYITDKLFISATKGFDESGENEVLIEYSLTDWLKLAGEAATDTSAGVDLIFEWEY